jgi:phage-related minor tail protein
MAIDSADPTADAGGFLDTIDTVDRRTQDLARSAEGFASAMTRAFSQSATSGRGLDDVLKSLGSRLSSLAVQAALKPLTSGLASGISQLFSTLLGGTGNSGDGEPNLAAAMGAIKPFATGGVIGTPTYFPLSPGGIGLAGEAGPEAILPLARGADGRLGVAAAGGAGAATISVTIATPDVDSFRRSEVYVTGQIARAVARGQRGL